MTANNYDYGRIHSDAKEGSAAKKALISMSRDLYNLYTRLNDEDDLPQWCHYKIAKSEDNLRTVTDYLLNKITKHCIDNNISTRKLQNEIKIYLKEEFINEGIFSNLFSSKSKKVRSFY